MSRTRFASYLLTALNALLLFMSFGYGLLEIPAWLQVAGRLHPLLLHFPIVLILLAVTASAFSPSFRRSAFGEPIWMVAALSTVLSAISGVMLSTESGYESDNLQWHFRSGVIVSLLSWFAYEFRERLFNRSYLRVSVAVILGISLTVTAHLGADITHGADFLLAPLKTPEAPLAISAEEADVFEHAVRPILQEKCMACHNENKAKGGLVMQTTALLQKGGKNGRLWDSSASDLGLMMRRIHLPESHKEHMPPKGKQQLTRDEIQLLEAWIRRGSPIELPWQSMDPSDTLHVPASHFIRLSEEEKYSFPPADESVIQKLNSEGRAVYPVSLGSPALVVRYYNPLNFSGESLRELDPVRAQVVEMNLSHMPADAQAISMLRNFRELRKLNLNFTKIDAAELKDLAGLPLLRSVSLNGVSLNTESLRSLLAAPNLRSVYAWSTGITAADADTLQKQFSNRKIYTGYRGDSVILKLNIPILEADASLIVDSLRVQLKQYVQGASIRYTLDGSEPDSLKSFEYTSPLWIRDPVRLKARVFKPGWISSETLQKNFFKSGMIPDSVWLASTPHEKYRGSGARTLIDRELGDFNFNNPQWLGYQGNTLDAYFFFRQARPIKNISINTLKDLGSYIFPAQEVEIWASTDGRQYRLLHREKPEQPKAMQARDMLSFSCPGTDTPIRYLRIRLTAVGKLPTWHPGKGDKGWVFVDEVFIN